MRFTVWLSAQMEKCWHQREGIRKSFCGMSALENSMARHWKGTSTEFLVSPSVQTVRPWPLAAQTRTSSFGTSILVNAAINLNLWDTWTASTAWLLALSQAAHCWHRGTPMGP